MLTEEAQLLEPVPLGVDTMPLGFVISDDGRTLLAVTGKTVCTADASLLLPKHLSENCQDLWTDLHSGNEDGVIELMTTPVAFIQQSDTIVRPAIKMNNSTPLVNSPVFQISLENFTTASIQQTTVLPSESNETVSIIVRENANTHIKGASSQLDNDASRSSEKVESFASSSIESVNKIPVKRSPGRPRKDVTLLTSNTASKMRCEICGQEFTRQLLYRKHMEHHAEEKPHRCPKCSASFNVPVSLKNVEHASIEQTNFTLHMATHNTGEPKCPECGRRFARMASLKSHMLLHEKEESLFCTECEDAFSTKAQLDAHLKLHNEKWTTEDVRKCKLCNKQFTQPALYRLHIREHYRSKIVKQTKRGTSHKTMYKCKICSKSFQKPSQLMRHIRVHTGEKPFKCTVCTRAFTQKGSLQIHMWQHVGVRPYSCEFCNAKFSQKGNLNAHILRVHNAPEGEPIYSCTHCTCVFKKLGSLNGHMKKMHSNRTEEPSQKCDSSTEADIRVTVDNVMTQLASLDGNVKNQADSTDPELTSTCKDDILQQALKNSGLPSKTKAEESLNKKADAQTSFVTLLDRVPDGSLRRYLTIKQRCIGSIRWYACSFCHKEFKKPSDLIRHLRVHTQEKPFKCSFCYRSFALKSTMIAHERTHTGTKKYACNACEKTFSCHSSLVSHTRTHGKPHKCDICDKSFSTSSVLKSHIKSHTKGKSKISPEAEILVPQIILEEPLIISDAGNKISVAQVQSKQKQVYNNADIARPHKCWVCPAAFRKISHLKQHYRRHTGERPYKCLKCDRRFTSNSVLKSHLHTHEESRPYSCSVCNAKFSTQSSMKRHLVTHSNKRPFMCPYCHKTFKTSVNCRKHMKIHKTELAQQQLEQQRTHRDIRVLSIKEKQVMPELSENLTHSEDMGVTFQSQIAPDFTQAFDDQFHTIADDKEKSFLPDGGITTQPIDNQTLPVVDTDNLGTSQTLHADETGTITLPNYSGDQTLTPESIREIEETLNQQLFNIGMNDPSSVPLAPRDQPVLNIIYDNAKGLDSVNNTSLNANIFPSHFDTFDMSQITLQVSTEDGRKVLPLPTIRFDSQTDAEMDMGISTANSTSMASILPRSAQEGQRLVPVTTGTNADDSPNKSSRHLMVVSSMQTCPELSRPVQACPKYSKVIAKADTTDSAEVLNIDCESSQRNTTICPSTSPEHESMIWTCELCHKLFKNQQLLEGHRKVHSLTNKIGQLTETNERSPIILERESLLQCHMCSKKGFTTETLKSHLSTHRGTKEFQCSACSLRFCSNGGLSRHLKMHASKSQWNCSMCFESLPNQGQLKEHAKIHENIGWKTGSAEADSSQKEPISINPADLLVATTASGSATADASISEKVLMDTVAERQIIDRSSGNPELNTEKKEYTNKCKYCPKTFRKPSDLIRHVRTHTGERPYHCEFCNKSFAVKCTLDCHMKVHSGQKTFCCHVCNSLFATKGSLKVHMRLHTGSKPFRCPMCDLRFRTSGHRKVHQLTHMREQKGGTKRKPKQLKVAAIANAVAEMEKTVANSVNVTVENEETSVTEYPDLDTITIDASDVTDQITFNADGTILNNNSMLSINESNQLVANLHFLLANGLVTIQADDSLLTQTASERETNVIGNETGVTSLIEQTNSNLCQQQQQQQQQQQSTCSGNSTEHLVLSTPLTDLGTTHLNKQQTAMQMNECMTLVQMNAVPTSVMEEKLQVQVQELPKQLLGKASASKKECDICGKTFMKPCQVERHKRIHTGERPYKCELCSKSFAQKATLQMHQKHHTGDRPHPCPHCDYSFTQKGNLQTHLKRAHQLDTLDVKKFRRGQQQQILSAKLQDHFDDGRILNLDDISFVELLK